jgi:hypothetical protein
MKKSACFLLTFLVAFSSAFSPAQISGKRRYRRSSPLYLCTKTAAKGSTDEKNVVNEKDESNPMELQMAVKSNSEFSYVDFAKNYPFVSLAIIHSCLNPSFFRQC